MQGFITFIIIIGPIVFFLRKWYLEGYKENILKIQKKKENEDSKLLRENKIKKRIQKAEGLQENLNEVTKILIPQITDYKNIIIDNEKIILEKGGDNQLFSFMKIDTFLRDYRGRIINDISGLD